MKKLLKLLGLAALAWLVYAGVRAWQVLNAHEVFKEPVFETAAPELPADLQHPAVLVFSKTNGFRHHDAIDAANALMQELAGRHGWSVYITENGAIHNAEQLARFDLLVWNNNTGDVLTEAQQQALRNWLEGGGQWLGLHGAGGSRSYGWAWYPQHLLKAQFIGHPLLPQFITATLQVEDRAHPATTHLDARWTREDEWYSFEQSPRAQGATVLVSLDETGYEPIPDLKMGDDHPLIWYHNVGQGRVFYSALGHKGSYYQEPAYRQLLENAAIWMLESAGQNKPIDKSLDSPLPPSLP